MRALVRSPSLASGRFFATEILIPLGAAVAAGAVVAAILPRRWLAGGLPYVLSYGKNVELTAVGAAFVAAAAARILAETRRGRWLAASVAAAGAGFAGWVGDPWILFSGWAQFLFVGLLVIALRVLWPAERSVGSDSGPSGDDQNPPSWVVALVLSILSVSAFVFSLAPLHIDVLHQGEVRAFALDLVRGGIPYESLVWSHGWHDCGITALWMLATGKIGTSPVVLASSTCTALGVFSAYALARSVLGSRSAALATSAVLALGPALLRDEATDLLYRLGTLLFVVLGLSSLTSRGRLRDLRAGACFALAYLFRIETGFFGALAGLAVIVTRGLPWRGHSGGARAFGSSLGQFFLGLMLVFAAFHLVLGWPGRAWFEYTLLELPRYHLDAFGIPFPWPVRGHQTIASGPVPAAAPIAWLFFVTLLLAQAARVVTRKAAVGGQGGSADRTPLLVFLALYSVLAARSSLGRSDVGHILQWSAFPLLATELLTLSLLQERFGWRPAVVSLLAASTVAFLDFVTLQTVPLLSQSPDAIWRHASLAGHILSEHLRPNPPAGACRDTTFTAAESERAANRRFIDDTCTVDTLLKSRHVTALVIDHTAPWYYERFGTTPPSRYVTLGHAYTPGRQLELIQDLRRHRPQALLKPERYGGLSALDVPDALRIPVVDAYLRERSRGIGPVGTPLGEIYFWDEETGCKPKPREDSPPPATDGAAVELSVEGAYYDPTASVLFASGSAIDKLNRGPLLALEPDADDLPDASLSYGLYRARAVWAFGTRALAGIGWELFAHLSAEQWSALERRRTMAVRGTLRDGRVIALSLPLAAIAELRGLSGAPWRDASREVERALALGRADRQASCGGLAAGSAGSD